MSSKGTKLRGKHTHTEISISVNQQGLFYVYKYWVVMFPKPPSCMTAMYDTLRGGQVDIDRRDQQGNR